MPVPSTQTAPIRAHLAHARAVEQIRAAILDGSFAPGEVLRISDLVQWLRLSRPPVQEALTALATEALVEFGPQRQWRVASIEEEDMQSLLGACGLILADAAQLAVTALDPNGRRDLAACMTPVFEALEAQAPDRLFAEAVSFFALVIAASDNAEVQRICELTGRRMQHHFSRRSLQQRFDWEACGEQYRALERAIIDGDVPRARMAIERLHGIER